MRRPHEKDLYRGNYIAVTEEDVDGHTFERVHMLPGVGVIPYHDGKVLLIYEKRVLNDAPRWKIVSGWMDKEGKSALETAKEELAEEAGLSAEVWLEMHDMRILDATVNTYKKYFVARTMTILTDKPENPDSDVVLTQKWFDEEAIWRMLQNGELASNEDTLHVLRTFREIEQIKSA